MSYSLAGHWYFSREVKLSLENPEGSAVRVQVGQAGALQISAVGKRVCFWGAPAFVKLESRDLKPLLADTGYNTGNLFIGNALYTHLNCREKSYDNDFGRMSPEEFSERYDLICVPASNFLNNYSDFGSQADYLSKINVPIFCFGLGSQLKPDEEIALKPGTLKFLRLLAERCSSVGVRGAFTADMMSRIGIKNVSLVGCPSLLHLNSNALQKIISRKSSVDKIAVNFSNNVRNHALYPSAMRATENSLFKSIIMMNAFYVIQNEIPELELLTALAREEIQQINSLMSCVANLFEINTLDDTVKKFLSTRLRVFFSISDWIGCMGTMTGCIGTRFHGNIASILSGTPALFLAHDMRTKELCELMRLPHILLDKCYTSDFLFERFIELDYHEFENQLGLMLKDWIQFAQVNGLDAIPY